MDFEVVCLRVMAKLLIFVVSPSMYADDNALIVAMKTWEENKIACTLAFREVRNYFVANSLALNEKKTEIVSFRYLDNLVPKKENNAGMKTRNQRKHPTPCSSLFGHVPLLTLAPM